MSSVHTKRQLVTLLNAKNGNNRRCYRQYSHKKFTINQLLIYCDVITVTTATTSIAGTNLEVVATARIKFINTY